MLCARTLINKQAVTDQQAGDSIDIRENAKKLRDESFKEFHLII